MFPLEMKEIKNPGKSNTFPYLVIFLSNLDMENKVANVDFF